LHDILEELHIPSLDDSDLDVAALNDGLSDVAGSSGAPSGVASLGDDASTDSALSLGAEGELQDTQEGIAALERRLDLATRIAGPIAGTVPFFFFKIVFRIEKLEIKIYFVPKFLALL